ncbi:TlpA family protein disulfide reductase [Kordia jejudonensis]|uniref:TlpA family protein disulfide reductase n=1 Tax=Kordia jejudonensis TaxID=1348245 RepID=UPI00138E43E8|nr:thioredoxin-like domain-containing protein [Kordia jejudonensis]
MKYHKIIMYSRLFSLLFFTLITLLSCEENKKTATKETNDTPVVVEKNDSLTLAVLFNEKMKTGISIPDEFLNYDYLEFENTQNKDALIVKTIPNLYDYQVLKYFGFSVIHGKMTTYRHYYLVHSDNQGIQFQFDKGNIVLKSEESDQLFFLDDLFQQYREINTSLDHVKLDSVYTFFQKKYHTTGQRILSTLNEYHYYNSLQLIEPKNEQVDTFIKKISHPIIAGDPLYNLTFTYVKDNIDTFDFSHLNTQNYSQNYIDLLSIGVFNFLKHQDNKGDKKYNSAIDWLKTTELYKKESSQIEKQIAPLNNTLFKKKLKNLQILSPQNKEFAFSDIIKSNPSKYYLIDFWATWCKPCIKGVHIMKEMEFPKNVSVISLSLDRKSDTEKWKKMTENLDQEISFLVKDEVSENQDFLKFIELQSVPRYIIVDKNLNLIDESFLHPQELLFLSKLNDLDNAKYW